MNVYQSTCVLNDMKIKIRVIGSSQIIALLAI